VVASPESVVNLRLDELPAAFDSRGTIALDLREVIEPAPPLPASFRLTDDGIVVPVRAGQDDGGKGAGGGRGAGPVRIGIDVAPEPGDVLVVRTLDPGLAALLPGLGGLVAETGSAVAPAILAREYSVRRWSGSRMRPASSAGTWVVVDGSTGEVSSSAGGEWVRHEAHRVASALFVMLISAWYVFVYLYRWEWNRAIVAGIIFLAAEVGLLGAASSVLSQARTASRRARRTSRRTRRRACCTSCAPARA
jgi:hypothetical protein